MKGGCHLKNLKIDDEFKSFIPALEAEEYRQLEENIIKDGCRDSLVIWDSTIIDGHNRYEICNKHQIEYETESKQFADREAAKEWIIRNQFGRRNITVYDKSVLALKLKAMFTEKAKEKQKEHGGTAPGKTLNQKSDEVNTSKELAKAAGVSHDTIHKVEVIEQMREAVRKAYRGDQWNWKVKRMPEAQVIRLYYSFLERGILKCSTRN
jgi:major membrane immunogen (membrane-anchored lipoprotein)